jgi:hypothetical protein
VAVPLVTSGELAAALEAYPGRRGLQRDRTALPLLRTRSESPRESVLRVIIVLAGLPEPECNYNVLAADGTFLARGDLVYPDPVALVARIRLRLRARGR